MAISFSGIMNAAVKRLHDKVTKELDTLLKTHAAQMEREIKESLNIGGRTGHVGPRGGKILAHSAPGEPPYKQTGRLQNSIGYRIDINTTTGSWKLDIGAIRGGREVKYAKRLEFGGADKRGVYIAARPYLFPVVLRHMGQLPGHIRTSIRSIRD